MVSAEPDATAAPYLDIKSVKLTGVDGLFLKATNETRGPVLLETDPAGNNIVYRICFDTKITTGDCTADERSLSSGALKQHIVARGLQFRIARADVRIEPRRRSCHRVRGDRHLRRNHE